MDHVLNTTINHCNQKTIVKLNTLLRLNNNFVLVVLCLAPTNNSI